MKSFSKRFLSSLWYLLLTWCSFLPYSQAQDYIAKVKHYGLEEGLSNQDVYAIHQDKKGFIWIGTKYGLNRFDGSSFKVYTKEKNGLASNTIHYIFEDDAEKLWLFDVNNWWFPISPKNISIFDKQANKILPFEKYFENTEIPFHAKDIFTAFSFDEGKLMITTLDGKFFIYQSKSGFRQIKYEESGYIPLIKSPNNTFWGSKVGSYTKKVEQLVGVDTFGQLSQRLTLPKRFENLVFIGIEDDHKLWFYSKTEPNLLTLSYLDTRKNKTVFYENEHNLLLDTISFDWTSQIAFWNKHNSFWYKQESKLLVFSVEKGLLYDFAAHYPEILNAGIQRFFFDNKGSTWIGTASGLYRVEIKQNPFTQFLNLNYDFYEFDKAYSCRGIVATEDELFVNTYKGRQRIRFSDRHQESIAPAFFLNEESDSVLVGILSLALSQDHEDYLWFGDVSLVRRDVYKETEEVFTAESGTEAILAWSIYEDEEKRIWIGTHNGLAYLNPDSRKFNRIAVSSKNETLSSSFIYSFVKSQNGHVWLSTTSGLYSWSPEKGVLNRYWINGKSGFKIPHDNIQHVHEDHEGVLWLATWGGGLIRLGFDNNMQIDTVKQFTSVDGFSNNNLYAVYEDQQEQLWMSSDYGIIQFDKNNHKAKAYLPEDGVTHYEFNRISHYKAKDGKLYFGGLNGVTAFSPDELIQEKEQYNAPLEITGYQQYQALSDQVVDLTSELLKDGKISLAPGDRFQYLSFALLEFVDSKQNRYRYKLEGLDADWNHIQENFIRLGTLPYGSYQLVIQGQGADGRFSNQTLNIPVEVVSPIYARSWFQLLIIGAIVSLIILYYKWRTRALKKRQIVLEEQVKERTYTIAQQTEELRQMDQVKSRFFTNVSHELRTPLTLILGPLSTVLKSRQLSPDHSKLIGTAHQNGKALLELVNEILDLTKMESGKLQLKEEAVSLYPLISRIIASFESFADYKQIQFRLTYKANRNLQLLLDTDKFQKIVNNLLSNAFKFTSKKGIVELSLNQLESEIELKITDTGRGIHPDDLAHVFNRFYQSKQLNVVAEGGTGVGLALCNEYAKLFKGQLTVDSTLGKGSTFIFRFPIKEVSDSQSLNGELTSNGNQRNTPETNNKKNTSAQNILLSESKKIATILLVEDNLDLREYIQLVLSKHYQVISVENGVEALEVLENEKMKVFPSLIVSDIMMPVMDGFQLLEKLKASREWRHIPVVMLTARAGISDKLKALRIGVDDYLTKPFEEEELQIRVANLLKNYAARMDWLKHNIEETNSESINSNELSSHFSKEDIEWLKSLEIIVQNYHSDATFNVERLTESLFISRRQLQRRIKQMTGLSPNQYIQEARMMQAQELLVTKSKSSVKATAYAVGIKDVKYFSQQYKKRFGKLPSSYF